MWYYALAANSHGLDNGTSCGAAVRYKLSGDEAVGAGQAWLAATTTTEHCSDMNNAGLGEEQEQTMDGTAPRPKCPSGSIDTVPGAHGTTDVQTLPSAEPPTPAPFPFLRLPLEIRLQIYYWMLFSAAAAVTMSANPELMFNCIPPTWGQSASVFGALVNQAQAQYRVVSDAPAKVANDAKDAAPPLAELLPAFRPTRRALPTSLLATCRRIYWEARTVAFETSEFVFTRLFASGLTTACTFVGGASIGAPLGPPSAGHSQGGLLPWQRAALRHMRLEMDVSVADIGWRGRGACRTDAPTTKQAMKQDEARAQERPRILDVRRWHGLCEGLSGLQDMRLLLNVTEEQTDRGEEEWQWQEEDDDSEGLANLFLAGLLHLASLRQLEIELVWVVRGRFWSRMANLSAKDRRESVAWCAAVERALNRSRAESRDGKGGTRALSLPASSVKVVCVERIDAEQKG